MAEEDRLKLYWELFFKAETGTYEKSTWLDLFLAEFLIRVNDGANPKELIKFCPVSGVVSLVGCELLCGIHRVTSSVSARAAPLPTRDSVCSAKLAELPSEDNDSNKEAEKAETEQRVQTSSLFTRCNAQSSTETLRQYLLGGVAWRGLVLLRALGVEGLSCCRQLSSVLIWLFGELSAGQASDSQRVSSATLLAPCSKLPIHQLFSQRVWSTQKLGSSHGSKNTNQPSDKPFVTSRSRTNQLKSEENKPKRKLNQTRHSEQSSESADSNEDLQILNKSLTIKLGSTSDDFDYFDSPVRSNEYTNETLYSDPFSIPKKFKPKADDYITEKHKEVIKSQITTFEFTLIIIDLLQELCSTESSLSGSEGSQISMQCINFSLRNLCSLQFGSMPSNTAHYDSNEVSQIKVALTELLMVSLDKVLLHSDLCAKLINNGILPMLLRILEDVICKKSPKYQSKEDQSGARQEKINKTESENLLKFVFGIAYSIMAFFHCLLMHCRSVDKLKEFTDQFKLYGECLKGGLLKDCIELMIRIPAEQVDVLILIKKIIDSLGRLINGMKRIRSEVVHSAACPRSRHKVCRQRVAAGMHHHHDILGEAGARLPLSSACCVSVLYGILTSLVTDEEVSAQPLLRTKILRVMLNCGVCCCFSPGFLMENMVRLMLTHNSVATMCLQVLEQTVYGELGASVLLPKETDQLPCSICEPCDDKRDLVKKYCPHGVSPFERKSVWSFLIHYNSLLQLDNHNNVLHATVSHLLRVTPKCRTEMKYELLFSVIYPTFIVAKHRYIIRMEESAYFLTVACLNIFTNLLNTVTFAEHFIQKGGLSYVLELVSHSEFSDQCCSILEIAIIVEIFKLIKENNDMSYYRELNSLTSVQMLFKSLSDMTDKCFKIYKLKLPAEKFEELKDVSKEKESITSLVGNHLEVQSRKHSIPILSSNTFAMSENVLEESIEDYMEMLKSICTFWKSCSSLCLYSPMFREYLVSDDVFADSYALLKVLLYYMCNYDCNPNEMRLLIKILEALLTVQLSVADVTSGRSKETSIEVVRWALGFSENAPQRGDEGGSGGSGGLRALCDALLRVAAARPSRRHAMPPAQPPKVPPLGCASGSTSADGSSSEDSAASPYASEHSEPHSRPDTGYEADVEIGKLELLSLSKSKKLSESLSNMDGIGAGVACAEYFGGGELAHPELCAVVVDVLSRLVHKLLTCQEECDTATFRAGVGLARAVCGRLTAALERAPRPPPGLLRPLLKPTVAPLLATNHPRLQDLQRSMLELVVSAARAGVSAGEAAALFRLFATDAPPLAPLLRALRRLAAEAPHTPYAILTFPVDVHNDSNLDNSGLSEENSFVIVGSATSQSQQAENAAKKLQDAHIRAGIRSVWAVHAGRVGIEGIGWAPWIQGFSLLLWMRPAAPASPATKLGDEWEDEDTAPESKKNDTTESPRLDAEPCHVITLGHDSLVFEIWLDVAGYLIFRLSRPEPGSMRAVAEARGATPLPSRRWACVALAVREVVLRRRLHIQVTVYINGGEGETVSLPLQGILVRKVSPTTVLVAQAGAAGGAGYHVAHALVYRAPVLNRYTALHLTAHGPDHGCQIHCDTPNYPLVLTPNVLDLKLDWDQVFEISSATLRELHDNLLLTFAAHTPDIVNLYHQTVVGATVFGGRMGAGLGGLGTLAGGGGGALSVPEALHVAWRAPPPCSRRRHLAAALHTLGGVDVLLYLVARVVELEGTGEEQALALGVLLRACRTDARLHAALYGGGGDDSSAGARLDLLLTVLAAPTCKLTHHLLKVILDEACSEPVLISVGHTLVVTRCNAALLRPRLLLLLMLAWKQLANAPELSWEVETSNGERVSMSGSPWALVLHCMCALLDTRGGEDSGGGRGNVRAAFNAMQMDRVDMLRHLLLACKERFLSSECGQLEPHASECVVALVRALLGSPPALDRLALLADFLLLMHQASDTFVTHARASFYFLLTADTPDASELTKRHTKRNRPRLYSRSQSEEIPSSSSVASSEAGDGGGGVEASLDSVEERGAPPAPPDKLLKGLINAQLKEDRNYNISSTSENSDVTNERWDTENGEKSVGLNSSDGRGAGLKKETELTDSVGGDEDETRTASERQLDDDQQSGSAAAIGEGAEGGEGACAGLLLLLRDALLALPAASLAQALSTVVRLESLLVLGKHRSADVRAAVVRCVGACARRSPNARPLASKAAPAPHDPIYYVHLANQISLYECSWELAAACAALITNCDTPLEDQLDDDIWMEVSEEAVVRSPPLLALLPSALADVPLAHNLTRIVSRLIDKASLKGLHEVYVVEVIVRSLRAVGEMEETREGRALLLEDLRRLLCQLVVKALAAPQTSSVASQTITDMHHLLTYAEWAGGAGAAAARSSHVALFLAQLDYLEDRLHSSFTATSIYANYFTTVLSSAVSLGQEGAARAERGELAARQSSTVARAVAFVTSQPFSDASVAELLAPLLDRLLAITLPACGGMDGSSSRARWWAGAGAGAGAGTGVAAGALEALRGLLWWAMAPAPAARPLQPRLLDALAAHPAAAHALTPHDPPMMRKLAVYLLMILKHIHASAEAGLPLVELPITDWARGWALGTQAGLAERLPSDSLAAEAQRLLEADEEKWAKQVARQRAHVHKSVFRGEALARSVGEAAMAATRAVVETQNALRKAFLQQLRRHASAAAARYSRWQRLRTAHTHPKAVWHCPASYPAAWQLDPTEGPGRVRVRLRRAHLRIPPRFLKTHARYKAETAERPAPLSSVIDVGAGLRGGLVARLQLNETVSHMAPVVYVTVASETRGELLLSDRCIHFVPEDSGPQSPAGQPRPPAEPAHSWPLDAVQQVCTRRWCLQECAVELFLSSGHAHLLAFADSTERSAFLKALANCHLPNRVEPDTLAEAMNQWRNGAITNWEYLMRLNSLAGRSYNDLMQYPVLPWVVTDYSSRILDLNDPASFRDLSKPMAIQNKNREQHYINTYNDLKAARREGCSPLLSRQPHHYAALYSNSGAVLHFLVRLPPFTELFLNYQDNNFDMPDRTFHSLATTWRLITNDSPTDVKELIPELFYLPELFHNNEGLELGMRQCGLGVDAVELPPWALDARVFTLAHRQALEAPLVTERLPLWIDLVFGFKQLGQPAVDAINVFPACTYYGFDPSELEDEVDRTAAAAMVRTYGQAPRQLLKTPHPHAAFDLHSLPTDQNAPAVWGGVSGGRWGNYCGSPSRGAAGVATRRAVGGAARLLALPAARAVAVCPRHTTLAHLSDGAEGRESSSLGASLALVSWGHSDSALRAKRRRDQPPQPLLHVPPHDQVTCVMTSISTENGGQPLIVGYASGRVEALRWRLAAARPTVTQLAAHRAPVVDACVCPRAGLLATASADGTVVLWDLHTLSYIRTLPNRGMIPATLVTISETLCDVATVHDPHRARVPTDDISDVNTDVASQDDAAVDDDDSYEKDSTYKYNSLIRVYTCNARFVGSVKVAETVTCICYSNALEGVSVNVVAAGLRGGGVRLYSSWDLRLVGRLPPLDRAVPLLSLTYSSDSSILFGCYVDGWVAAWESGGNGKAVRIQPAHALL